MSANVNVIKSQERRAILARSAILINGNVVVSAKCFSQERKMIRPALSVFVVAVVCGLVHFSEIEGVQALCLLESRGKLKDV